MELNCGKKRQNMSAGKLQEDQYGEWLRAPQVGRLSRQITEKGQEYMAKPGFQLTAGGRAHSGTERIQQEKITSAKLITSNSREVEVKAVNIDLTHGSRALENSMIDLSGDAGIISELKWKDEGQRESEKVVPRTERIQRQVAKCSGLEGTKLEGGLDSLNIQIMEIIEPLVNVPIHDTEPKAVLRELDSNIAGGSSVTKAVKNNRK